MTPTPPRPRTLVGGLLPRDATREQKAALVAAVKRIAAQAPDDPDSPAPEYPPDAPRG